MRCFTVLVVVLAISADCLGQNVAVPKTTRKSDRSRTKLCEHILQKLELTQRDEDKKTLIPLDNIISLFEIIRKSSSRESGQSNESSGGNKDLDKNNDSLGDSNRRFRGRFHWRPRVPHEAIVHAIDVAPDVIRAIRTRPDYDRDEDRSYLESSYYHPTERRLDLDPPPIEPRAPILRPRIHSAEIHVIDDSKKDGSEMHVKENPIKQTILTEIRGDDLTESGKITRSPKQSSNETLALLKHLMGTKDNMKVKSFLKALIANHRAAIADEKKGRTQPLEVVNTVKKVDSLKKSNSKESSKIERAQAALSDKKLPSRSTKQTTNKSKPITDVPSNRLGLNDEWDWDTEPMPLTPRRSRHKINHEDANINKNVNVNTNNDRDIVRVPKLGSRRSFGSRAHRHHHDYLVDKNKNINSNVNSNGDPEQVSGQPSDRHVSMRRSLDSSLDDDHNTNVNSNVNTNSNVNRRIVPRNKRRGREPWRLV